MVKRRLISPLSPNMLSFFHYFLHFLYRYVMVVGVIATNLEGKKQPTSTPKAVKSKKSAIRVSAAKKVKVKKVNKFYDNVTFSNVSKRNSHFRHEWYDTFLLSVNTRMPPQQQRRAHAVNGRINYYDPSTFDKECFRKEVIKQIGAFTPFGGAVYVLVRFYYSIPQNNPTSIQKFDPYDKTPDIDNLQKFMFDALNPLFYTDDCRVVHVNALKSYDDHDHVEIYLAHSKCHRPNVGGQVIDLVGSDDSDDDEEDLFDMHRR